ncbi:MAG: hypothetical protein UGE37_07600 [Dialister hominis]|nr:hypothetical protein [Dialister sp.]MEE1349985.1 hypothetical protein [Dialister hominis]
MTKLLHMLSQPLRIYFLIVTAFSQDFLGRMRGDSSAYPMASAA